MEIRNRKQKLILAHYANPHVRDQRVHQSAERQPHYLAKYSNASTASHYRHIDELSLGFFGLCSIQMRENLQASVYGAVGVFV